jgi:nucleoside-diphosphate kinase
MVWEGKEVVKYGRTMIGATNPLASAPGTIRGDYGIDVGRNIVHGSDSVEVRRGDAGMRARSMGGGGTALMLV